MDLYARVAYNSNARGSRALCFTHSPDDEEEISARCLGTILLNRKDLTHEVISHECGHAALGWWRHIHGEALRGSAVIPADQEERLVLAIGSLTLQVEAAVEQYRSKVDLGETED